MMPGRDHVGHALPAILVGGEADKQGARRFRLLQDANRHLGDDTDRPSEPFIRPSRS